MAHRQRLIAVLVACVLLVVAASRTAQAEERHEQVSRLLANIPAVSSKGLDALSAQGLVEGSTANPNLDEVAVILWDEATGTRRKIETPAPSGNGAVMVNGTLR